ncbi:ATP-binding cassette domain-containing protein [Candidatus Woesearchaeota archaeon]|nr:ATP-binding cassette domain-containing protein [Candidatus Woesearchaeota archaeon]
MSVEPRYLEEEPDWEFSKLIPESLEVIRTKALPYQWTRCIGIGDLGIRSFFHQLQAAKTICKQRKIDLLFISGPPWYAFLVGPLIKKRFGIPYVIDYIDPWVSPVGLAAPFWKKLYWYTKIAGFLEPTEGEVVYFSKVDHEPKNLHKNFHKIKKHIGFTPQHTSFYPKLTVKENMLHFGKMYGVNKSTLLTNAQGILEFTGLHSHQNKLAEHLSGGMQKRLDISCSLVHKPKLLMLDEPTADLDPLSQEEVIELVKAMNAQGVTIVIASHHLDSLERICTKLAIVHNGQVRSYGGVDEVLKPFLKESLVINIPTGRERDKIIQLVRRLPVTKIIDQGHQLVVYPYNPEQTLIALLRIIKDEHLYFNDLDLRKPSLKEVLTKIVQEGVLK